MARVPCVGSDRASIGGLCNYLKTENSSPSKSPVFSVSLLETDNFPPSVEAPTLSSLVELQEGICVVRCPS